MAIHLGRPLPSASRDLPGQQRENTPAGQSPACHPYSVLLPVGFALPPPSPGVRCALTAPFHPYRPTLRRAGGLLSVALSLGSPPPGVTRHRISVEPGLSSPRSRKNEKQPSDRLTPPISGRDVTRRQVIPRRTQRSFNLANVSRSITPSMQAGRKCLWNAMMDGVGFMSSTP